MIVLPSRVVIFDPAIRPDFNLREHPPSTKIQTSTMQETAITEKQKVNQHKYFSGIIFLSQESPAR
jgi:hypothetical protein